MTVERGMVTELRILHDWLAGPNRFKELPQVGAEIVIVVAVVSHGLGGRLSSWSGIVFVMPLLEVGISEARRERSRVIAGREVDTGLRREGHAEFAQFDGAFRSL